MPRNIVLNGISYSFGEKNLPCLITYREGGGGSQMSITLVADLFLRGYKLLMLTAYPMAKENFLEQIKGREADLLCIEKEEDLRNADKYQAIIIKSGNEELFTKSLNILPDINERVVLIKNVEVFSNELMAKVLSLPRIIFSGDIDKCVAKNELAEKDYKTMIIFSKPEINLPVMPPEELEKYSAYMWNAEGETGVVKVKI